MRFLLDQNIERRLATFLKNLGHDVKVVSIDYPAGKPDQDVLNFAHQESRILITNDKGDFGDLIFRHHLPHSGVILFRRIRSGDLSTKQERLSYVLKAYVNQFHNFFIVTPKSVRVRLTPGLKKIA